MKTNYLIILSFIVFFSCQKNNVVLQNVFSEEEITEVDKLIQYYETLRTPIKPIYR